MATRRKTGSTWLDRLLWLDRSLAHIEINIASVALAAGLVISLYTIAARAVLVPTAEWVLELPMELMVVASIYGSGYLIRQNRHLSVDIIVRRLPARGERLIALVVRTCLALLSFFLAERAIKAAGQAARVGLTIPELFNLSTAIPLGIASAGFALWGLHFGVSLIELVQGEEESSTEDGARPEVYGPSHEV